MIKRIVFVAAAFYDVMRIFFFFHKFTLGRKEHLFYNENTEQMFVQVRGIYADSGKHVYV